MTSTLEHSQQMRRIGIPELFWDRTFDNYEATDPKQIANLSWALEFAEHVNESPRSGMLLGNMGTGKTHLGVAVLKVAAGILGSFFCEATCELVERVRYATVAQIVQGVKDSWASRDITEGSIIEKVTAPRLLVLDEVEGSGSDFERSLLFRIMDTRYGAMKPTLLISNRPLEDVSTLLGPRVMDRLREHGSDLRVFDWESHRKQGVIA